jgi:TonB family protein
MKPRIRVVPRRDVSVVPDHEIQQLMNFNGLVQSAGQLTLWAKLMGTVNAKIITGGLAVVSVSSVLVWVAQDNAPVPPGNQSAAIPVVTAPQPIVPAVTVDSVEPMKDAPAQRLPPVRVAPSKPNEAAPTQVATPVPAATEPVTTVSYQQATPIDGFTELYAYFSREIHYPEEGLPDSIQGVATATFVIDRKGNVGRVTVLNSLGPAFDAEIMRLIRNMPAWNPATVNGHAVPSMFSIPLNFQVQKSKP